jgi:hypothetical protein
LFHNQNRNIASGIRAIGGIGLNNSRIYLTKDNFLIVPKIKAKITPKILAIQNPTKILFILKKISLYMSELNISILK